MAKLPPIDVTAYWIRDLLNRGKRPEALALLDRVMASGRARAETIALAEYLRTAKRGRQPFGAKHLWYDIGIDNDELRTAGLPYEQRLEKLSLQYRLGDLSKVKTAIAQYEEAMDSIRTDFEEPI